MKAAVLHGSKDIRYEEIDTPRIGHDEVLVKVKATGVCGSDLPRVLGNAAHFYPIVLGHEFSGEVTEVGDRVTNVSVGDRVAGAPLLPCHTCVDCARGRYSQCKNYSFIGSRTAGSWAEYVKVPARNVVVLPPDVSFIEGAFLEPTTVALHGLSVMGFHGGTDVAIFGMGTIGLLTLQCAKLLGAKRLFAFDIDESKLTLARRFGADVCLNTQDPQFREVAKAETDGYGFEMVLETAGVEATEKLSLEMASSRGNVMYIGTPSRDISFTPREFEHINRKELTVRGSWMSYSAPFPGDEWSLAVYYFEKSRLSVEGLIDRVSPLSDVGQVFADYRVPGKVKGKVVFEP